MNQSSATEPSAPVPSSKQAGVSVAVPASDRTPSRSRPGKDHGPIEDSSWEALWDGGPDEPIVKPFSITRRSADRRSILKIYRGVEPCERRSREVEALVQAPEWGISVPEVKATGKHAGYPWIIVSTVPGVACQIRTNADVKQYVRQVRALTDRLQKVSDRLGPGAGWGRTRSPALSSHREFLLRQLSRRCRAHVWWDDLSSALLAVEEDSTVYLHGDLKAEHMFAIGNQVHVIDWEACARGPAACDNADAVFHVIRDLHFDDVPVRQGTIDLLAELSTPGAVLAWRLIRWLDRRRPNDLDLVSPTDVSDLALQFDPASACQQLVKVVSALRARGAPR